MDAGGRRRVLITRMHLPAARAAAKAAASTAHLSATTTSTLIRPITLAASGITTLGSATLSALNTVAFVTRHGHRKVLEPDALAPGTAIFKPRVVRFVLPRVFCHAQGLPPSAMLKVRTEPGGDGGEGSDGGGGGDCKVLGRLGAGQCVIAWATSGDWLQVRYKNYEAAWMLMMYRGRRLMAPLPDVYPGVVIVVAAGGGSRDGVRDSPFPMPLEVLEKEKEMAGAVAAEKSGVSPVDGSGETGAG